LNDTPDKVKALRSGGVDYITKPFQFEEVRARIDTQLNLYQLRQALERHNEQLEAAVAARTRELAESNARLTILDKSKSEFLGLISHEFRTPLNGLMGVGDLILADMPPTPQNLRLQELFQGSSHRILCLLEDALLLTQIDIGKDGFEPAPVAIEQVMRRAFDSTRSLAESSGVLICCAGAGSNIVLGNEDLLTRALHSLLSMAIKFSAPGERARVAIEPVEGSLRITIEGRGKVLPADAIPKFFEVFSIGEASTPAGPLGLEPSLARRILALFGGTVSVGRLDPAGIRFSMSFPQYSPGEMRAA
jgi:two-component system sensor histidine kinase/response regulator